MKRVAIPGSTLTVQIQITRWRIVNKSLLDHWPGMDKEYQMDYLTPDGNPLPPGLINHYWEGADKILGPGKASPETLHKLVGATPDAKVKISYAFDNDMQIITKSPKFTSIRTVHKDKDGNLWMKNDYFVVKTPKGGLGIKIFTDQVKQLKKLGFSYIKTQAEMAQKTSAGTGGF